MPSSPFARSSAPLVVSQGCANNSPFAELADTRRVLALIGAGLGAGVGVGTGAAVGLATGEAAGVGAVAVGAGLGTETAVGSAAARGVTVKLGERLGTAGMTAA